MKSILTVFLSLTLVLLLAITVSGGVAIHARSTVIGEQQEYQARWADVESQYQRRVSLIPNLTNTVKGYVKEESDVWQKFAAARSQVEKMPAQDAGRAADPDKQRAFIQSQERLSIRLNAVQEAYPQLKSDVMFVRLMDELAGTENRINVASERYTRSVADYNKTVGMWASFFGYKPVAYYQADQGASTAPAVSF